MANLITLPDIVLEHIFHFLSYDSIAQNRLVCKHFNMVGGRVLNKGFYAVERYNNKALREIKAKLPRRESERRNHPLARQCDVLISVETRINMLAMTFSKWINNNTSCFIPGKVIDEIYRVLRCVLHEPNPPRAHEILQELRDISSMAMEHFDEKILPQMKKTYYRSRDTLIHFSDRGGLEELNSIMKKSRLLVPVVSMPLLPEKSRMRILHRLTVNGAQSNQMKLSDYQKILEDASRHPDKASQDTASPTPSTSFDHQEEYRRLLHLESGNRRKLNAQSSQLANQAKEISELRKQVEEFEAKFRELNAILKVHNVPTVATPESLQGESPPSLKRPSDSTEESRAKFPRI